MSDNIVRVARYRLEGLQIENESSKHQIKHLETIISTYRDEITKFEKEKGEMIKRINHFDEELEERASLVFLKSDIISNLKQEIVALTKANQHYKQNIIKMNEKMKCLEIENNELRDQNIKYETSLNESRLNEDLLTKSYGQQTSELLHTKNSLNEYQRKYDKLCLENCAVHETISKLNEDIDEINMIQITDENKHSVTQSYHHRFVMTPKSMKQSINIKKNITPKTPLLMAPSSTKQTSLNMANIYSFDSIDFDALSDADYDFEIKYDQLLAEQELMENEWSKKCQDLTDENERHRQLLCSLGLLTQNGDTADMKKKKHKSSEERNKEKKLKIKSLETKAKIMCLNNKRKRYNYWGMPCITNNYLKR